MNLISMERQRPLSAKKIDLEQFNNINSKEISYILGLVWADGYVHKYKVSTSGVAEDLKELLPIFLKTGEWCHYFYENKRYTKTCKPSMTIYAANKRLANIFINNDYHIKKKASADKILSKIPIDLQYYWFRGLFDGDGYIWYSTKGMYKITITSSIEQNWNFLQKLCQKLKIKFRIERDSYRNKQNKINSRSVFIINNYLSVKMFCEYIYKDRKNDNIGLTRKYKKWLEIKNFIKNRPYHPNQIKE